MSNYNEKRARENSKKVNDWRARNQTGGRTPWVGRTLSQQEWEEIERYDHEHRIELPRRNEDSLTDDIFSMVFDFVGKWLLRGCGCVTILSIAFGLYFALGLVLQAKLGG